MDFEIVGLHHSSNGRSCSIHQRCGSSVLVGDVLRLVNTTVTVDGVDEPAIKCVKVIDGIDTCTVAFVPRVQAQLSKVKDNINRFVQVVELYTDSDSPYKRSSIIAQVNERRFFERCGVCNHPNNGSEKCEALTPIGFFEIIEKIS